MSAGGFTFKRGTTFALTADFGDDEGVPVDLTGATLQAELRDSLDNLVATLVLVADPTVLGRAAITLPRGMSTAAWPLSQLRCDILVQWSATSVQQTETFVVDVIPAVTR